MQAPEVRDYLRRVELLNFRNHSRRVTLRLSERDSTLQPSKQCMVVLPSPRLELGGSKRQWDPQFGGSAIPPLSPYRELETPGHNANYGQRLTVKQDGSSENVRIRTITPLPQTVTQNQNRMARLILVGSKRAAKDRFDTEKRKESSRGTRRLDSLRLTAARKLVTLVAVHREALECSLTL